MTSTYLMQGLLCVYLVIAVVALWEGNYPRALYWYSACLLTISILWGT